MSLIHNYNRPPTLLLSNETPMFAKGDGPGQVGADLVKPDFQELSASVGAQQEELQASHLRCFQHALRHLHRYNSPVKSYNRKVY